MKRATAFILFGLAAAGCASPKARQIEAEKARVRDRLHTYEGLMLAMDIPGLTAMFAPEGEMVNPKRPPVHGREAISKFLGDYADFKVLANTDTPTSTLIDGDTAEQIGTYHQRVRSPEGKEFETSGRLEIEWAKGPSGEWLIVQMATFPGE
jgi:ketosteroid isomerase-like protein